MGADEDFVPQPSQHPLLFYVLVRKTVKVRTRAEAESVQ